MQRIGVDGTLLDWFSSYLNLRSQRVVIKGRFSKYRTLLSGVPQGSILGPFLFLIFIDDIECNLDSDITLFADDTALLKDYSDPVNAELILNSDLEKISVWGKNWMVNFNPSKTVFLNFSFKKKKSVLNLHFNDISVAQVTEQKHLGVILSDDMK